VQLLDLIPLFSRRTVALKSLLNRIQQILVPKRLCQKFDRTRLQSPDRHGYIAMCGNKDDGNRYAELSQHALKIQSAHLGQSYVQNQATRVGRPLLAQKLLPGREGFCAKSNRLDEILDGPAHPTIVIDDKHGGNGSWLHS
jgi:hypothetical protein